MNQHRIAVAALAAIGMGALAACHHSQLTDVQITRLLHVQQASATDPAAPIDPSAVNCLRVWSGDVELSASLPPAMQTMKDTCRQRLDGWITDAMRNPDKITFEQASMPVNVHRAMALMAEHRSANAMRLTPQQQDRAPAAMMSKSPMPGAAAIPTPPAGPVDLTAAKSAVDELDGLCQKAKQAAASGDTQPMARYASFCDKRVDQLRSRISIVEQSGDERQAQTLTGNVQRTLEMARRIASRPAPQEPVKN